MAEILPKRRKTLSNRSINDDNAEYKSTCKCAAYRHLVTSLDAKNLLTGVKKHTQPTIHSRKKPSLLIQLLL